MLSTAFGRCPRCNADAPAVYRCRVCMEEKGKTNDRYLKAAWWVVWLHRDFERLQSDYEYRCDIYEQSIIEKILKVPDLGDKS